MSKIKYSITIIHTRYKIFLKDMRDIWESYNLIDFYMPQVHKLLKKDGLKPLSYKNLSGDTIDITKNYTFGAISHLTRKANPRRALIDAIAYFEHYLSELEKQVYLDYPGKLSATSNSDSGEGYSKLLRFIINSETREEIVHKLVEEKIRSLFYGKPIDFFLKDKAKLEFGQHFNNFSAQLEDYSELVARRNIIIHNNSKVDRKYLREVKGSSFKVGQKIKITSEYVWKSILLLCGLSAEATALPIRNIYKQEPRGSIAFGCKKFTEQKTIFY